MPKVSIIIPCYNHGMYIADAIESVNKIVDKDLYEVIIINDGSTDGHTNDVLKKYAEKGFKVIFQKNMGLSEARNNGISIAKGEYILPLDSDNMIRPEYIYKSIKIFEQYPDISIVYGNAQLFGEKIGTIIPGPFNLQKLMITNYIDACAIYRKKVWEETNGYDKNVATEDWEFWMHAAFKGFKFHYINEILFDYRLLSNSMVREINKSKIKGNNIIEYMMSKHKYYYGPQYIDADIMAKFNTSPVGFISKLILKRYFPTKFNNLVSKGKLRRYI